MLWKKKEEKKVLQLAKMHKLYVKKYRTFRRVNYLLPKLDDTIPRGGIHTEYFKYETSIVECIQDAALLTVTQL